jgi:hypothetical protein
MKERADNKEEKNRRREKKRMTLPSLLLKNI